MKIHTPVTRLQQLSSRKVIRAFYLIGFATLVFSFSKQTFAQEESEDDPVRARYHAIAAEIADLRMQEAVQSHWSDTTGFSMAPMKLEEEVQLSDSDRIKQLEEGNAAIWKIVGPAFAQRYARRQQPLNDRHLQKSGELRSLINEAIKGTSLARGGGSTSGQLYDFAIGETEWILRQLWNGSASSISDKSFEKRLRGVLENREYGPDDAKEFSRSLELFRSAQRLLTPEQ